MPDPRDTVGIVAGGGSLPGEIADAIIARSGRVHIIWVEGAADAALKRFPHTSVNWAGLGRAVKALRQAGARRVIFLGKAARPEWKTGKPDLMFFSVLPRIVRLMSGGGDDAILRALLAIFESKGFEICGVSQIAPELLAPSGILGATKPTAADNADIIKGFQLVEALGAHDIGQGAIISSGVIEAIEGAEGTDNMLARVREQRISRGESLAKMRAGVIVKRPKPGQDLRVDLPAIGPQTIDKAAAAGLRGVAVMSGHVLLAERAELLRRAEAQKIFVEGRKLNGDLDKQARAETVSLPDQTLSSRQALPLQAAWITKAAAIARDVSAFAPACSLIISRGRVLAIGTSETPRDVIQRAAPFMRGKNRAGVLFVSDAAALDAGVLDAVQRANIAGVGCFQGATVQTDLDWLKSTADANELFLLQVSNAARGSST